VPRPGWDESDPLATSGNPATLKFATALVKDGFSGVTVVLPRSPHVLAQAREAAAAAGVQIEVEKIGGASITLRFLAQSPLRREPGADERTTRRGRGRLSGLPERWAARALRWASSVRTRRR
jgi:hypothetical protein